MSNCRNTDIRDFEAKVTLTLIAAVVVLVTSLTWSVTWIVSLNKQINQMVADEAGYIETIKHQWGMFQTLLGKIPEQRNTDGYNITDATFSDSIWTEHPGEPGLEPGGSPALPQTDP